MQEKIENIIDKDIEILEKMKECSLSAAECSLTSGSERKEWKREAQAIENLIEVYKELERRYKRTLKKCEDLVVGRDNTIELERKEILDYTKSVIKEKDIEINKLNEVIDRMADFIFTYDCCRHFAENRVKCKMNGFETTLGNCKNNCIKDYFRKKVENE